MERSVENLAYSLSRLAADIHTLHKLSEKKCGVSLIQWSLLSYVIDHPATSSLEISKELKIHPSTLSVILKKMEEKNLLMIIPDPRDSRKKMISATKRGTQKQIEAKKFMDLILDFSLEANTISSVSSDIEKALKRCSL